MIIDKINKAKELYNQKLQNEALTLYEEIKLEDLESFNRYCKFYYMWCLYNQKINRDEAFEPPNIEDTRKHVTYITNNLRNKDLLFQITVLRVIKYLDSKPNFEAIKINQWLDKLNPQLLSTESTKYTPTKDKEIIYLSNQEKWFSLKSKACEKLEMYHECIIISEEALKTLKEFNYNNDIWFKYRIAKSKAMLGDFENSLEILRDITKVKKDWFIYMEIGSILVKKGNYEDALNSFITALQRPSSDDKKIKLYIRLAELFFHKGKTEDAQLLMDYTIGIKTINNWKLNETEKQYLQKHKKSIDTINTKLLKKEIVKLIARYKWKDQTIQTGVIQKILPNGKAGFITTDKESYYFRFNSITNNKGNVSEGYKVIFYLEKSYDKKKNQETMVAVNIVLRSS